MTSDMHIIQQENPCKSTKGRRFAGDDEDGGCITSRSVWKMCFPHSRKGRDSVPGSADKLMETLCFLRGSFRFEDQTPGHFSSHWEGEDKDWKKESLKPEPDFFLSSAITSAHNKYISPFPSLLWVRRQFSFYYGFHTSVGS